MAFKNIKGFIKMRIVVNTVINNNNINKSVHLAIKDFAKVNT